LDAGAEDAAAEQQPVAVASAVDQEDASLIFQQEILKRLQLIEQQSSDYHRRSAHRESVIDRLHAENEELRDNSRRAVFEPVAADLIRLYDHLASELERLARASADPAITKLMMSFTQDIELMLDRCGFELFTAVAGDPFVVGEHAVAAVTETEDESLNKTVARVVSAGLRDRESGKIRRPLKAQVYRFAGPPEPGPPEHCSEVDPTTPGSSEQAVPGSDLGE
jgi:molecular chaperone GrpE (heat shock protein)